MKTLFILNEGFEVEILSVVDFLFRYGETTTTPYGVRCSYFWDEEDGYIYHWLSGRKIKTWIHFDRVGDALDYLCSQVLEECSVNVFSTMDELRSYVEELIKEEEDEEIIEKLKKSIDF